MPIAYFSKVMNSCEQDYSKAEKECLAVLYAVTNFRSYLYGREFILACDYEPVHWMTYIKNPGAEPSKVEPSSTSQEPPDFTGRITQTRKPIQPGNPFTSGSSVKFALPLRNKGKHSVPDQSPSTQQRLKPRFHCNRPSRLAQCLSGEEGRKGLCSQKSPRSLQAPE